MARSNLSEVDERKPALLIDHSVDRERATQHADDLQLLFMKWIAFKIAVRCVWIRHEPGTMKGGDRLGMRKAGRNHFASARIGGHEMRFYQARDDLEIRRG